MNNMVNNIQNNNTIINNRRNKSMSKSTDDMRESQRDLNLDSNTLKRMLKPMTSNESPMTSPEMTRRRWVSREDDGSQLGSYRSYDCRYASNYYNSHHQTHHQHQYRDHHANNRNVMSDVEGTPRGHHKQIITDRDRTARFSGSRYGIIHSNCFVHKCYANNARLQVVTRNRKRIPEPGQRLIPGAGEERGPSSGYVAPFGQRSLRQPMLRDNSKL